MPDLPAESGSFPDALSAARHYIRITSFFQTANKSSSSGSTRGTARAPISVACVIRLYAWQPGKMWLDGRFKTRTIDDVALLLLVKAEIYLQHTGDRALSNLVVMHQLLSSKISHEIKSRARDVGRWARNMDSDALAGFLDLLPYRMGIHFRYICSDFHKSSACFEFSRQVSARLISHRVIW